MKLDFFNSVRWTMEFQVGGLKIHHEESAHASMRCNSFLYEKFYDKLTKFSELIPNKLLPITDIDICLV